MVVDVYVVLTQVDVNHVDSQYSATLNPRFVIPTTPTILTLLTYLANQTDDCGARIACPTFTTPIARAVLATPLTASRFDKLVVFTAVCYHG